MNTKILLTFFALTMSSTSFAVEMTQGTSDITVALTAGTINVISSTLNNVTKGASSTAEAASQLMGGMLNFSVEGISSSAQATSNGLINIIDVSGQSVSITINTFLRILELSSNASSNLTDNIFYLNKAEVNKAIEREDNATIESLKDAIRSRINLEFKHGNNLNQAISDENIEQYVISQLN